MKKTICIILVVGLLVMTSPISNKKKGCRIEIKEDGKIVLVCGDEVKGDPPYPWN